MGKKGDLSDFERGRIVGARRAGRSISETADLLGFSRTTISRVYRQWSEKEKTTTERKSCGRKCLVDLKGQKKIDKLVRDDTKATVAEITKRYNQGMQNTISERTTRRILKQMGYSFRKPHQLPPEPCWGQDTPVEPSRGPDTPVETGRGQDTPMEPSRGQDTPVEPSRGHDTPVEPSRGQDTPMEPSRGQDTPVEPSRGHDTPVEPSRGQDTPMEHSKMQSTPVELISSNG